MIQKDFICPKCLKICEENIDYLEIQGENGEKILLPCYSKYCNECEIEY